MKYYNKIFILNNKIKGTHKKSYQVINIITSISGIM